MPPKKAKKPRKPRAARSATEKKKGLKQKQKQKQVVNVQVSSGGGGTSGFIPIPQAPSIDYSLLSNLLRPANVVDVPIRAAAPMAESIATRAAGTQTLAEATRAAEEPTFKQPFIAATDFPSESEGEGGFISKKKGGRPVGSKNKPRPIAVAVEGEFMPMRGSEFERMTEAQKELSGQRRFINIGQGGESVSSRFERLPSIQRAGASSFGGM